LAIKVLNFS